MFDVRNKIPIIITLLNKSIPQGLVKSVELCSPLPPRLCREKNRASKQEVGERRRWTKILIYNLSMRTIFKKLEIRNLSTLKSLFNKLQISLSSSSEYILRFKDGFKKTTHFLLLIKLYLLFLCVLSTYTKKQTLVLFECMKLVIDKGRSINLLLNLLPKGAMTHKLASLISSIWNLEFNTRFETLSKLFSSISFNFILPLTKNSRSDLTTNHSSFLNTLITLLTNLLANRLILNSKFLFTSFAVKGTNSLNPKFYSNNLAAKKNFNSNPNLSIFSKNNSVLSGNSNRNIYTSNLLSSSWPTDKDPQFNSETI